MLLAIGHKSLRVGVEFVKRAFDVGARPGDEFLELDAPMVAKVRPFGILPEIDRRYFGRVSQRLAKVRAKLLVELVARHDAGAIEFTNSPSSRRRFSFSFDVAQAMNKPAHFFAASSLFPSRQWRGRARNRHRSAAGRRR